VLFITILAAGFTETTQITVVTPGLDLKQIPGDRLVKSRLIVGS
jgi:hypothetical protein